MRKRSRWMVEFMLGGALVLVGCGAADPGTTPVGQGGAGGNAGPPITDGAAYFPLALGATWTYRITNPAGTMADKMTSIEAMEPSDGIDGPPAFRVRNEALDGATINWEQLSGMVAVRYRQSALDVDGNLLIKKTYAPSSVVFDELGSHLVAGASWNETYQETQAPTAGQPKTSQEFVKWTVEATDDVVTVPAGTFTCVRVRRHHTSSKNPADEVSWYARDMGMVKETGAGSLSDQTRELVSASLP